MTLPETITIWRLDHRDGTGLNERTDRTASC